jgi:hypothetical protein
MWNMHLKLHAFIISAVDGGKERKRVMYPLYRAKLRNYTKWAYMA